MSKRLRLATTIGAAALAAISALAVPLGTSSAQAATTTAPNCGATVYKADGTPWTCTFDDEFSGTLLGSGLDSSKWVTMSTANTGFFMGYTCMSPNNVSVSGGYLKIKVTKSLFAGTCTGAPFKTMYTGGAVSTGSKFQQAYGMFSARILFPAALANQTSPYWGGFWMTPTYPKTVTPDAAGYGPWPWGGENDIAEWFANYPNLITSTLHYENTPAAQMTTPQADETVETNACVFNPAQWNTYTLVWTPTTMTYQVNGTTCYATGWGSAAYGHAGAPFDQPFSIDFDFGQLLNGTTAPAKGVVFPATEEVDWVHAWS